MNFYVVLFYIYALFCSWMFFLCYTCLCVCCVKMFFLSIFICWNFILSYNKWYFNVKLFLPNTCTWDQYICVSLCLDANVCSIICWQRTTICVMQTCPCNYGIIIFRRKLKYWIHGLVMMWKKIIWLRF